MPIGEPLPVNLKRRHLILLPTSRREHLGLQCVLIAVCFPLGCDVGSFAKELYQRKAPAVLVVTAFFFQPLYEIFRPMVVPKHKRYAVHEDFLEHVEHVAVIGFFEHL